MTVTSVTTRGDLVLLGLPSGQVEIEKGSHADLPKVKAGTTVEVNVNKKNQQRLHAGNAVAGTFIGIVVTPASTMPRTSDSNNS